jgi:hypothetical protein
MTDTETKDKIVTKPKKTIRAITQEDLVAFREEMLNVLDARLDAFVEDFMDAWSDAGEACKEENPEEQCTCPECTSEHPLDNPRRYMIQAGGNTWWVDSYKPNAVYGIDAFWTEELGGKIKNIKGTIMDANIAIFDFESDMTLDIFENIRKQTIDYAIHAAQEAQAKDQAMKAAQSETPHDVSHVSYG